MGGAQYQAKILLERLVETTDHEIHYLARRVPDYRTAPGHTIHKIGNSTGMNFLFDAKSLLRTLTELAPDTIYCHVASAYVGLAAWYTKRHSARLVWHFASDIDVEPWHLGQRKNPPMSFLDKKVVEYGLARADVLVAQTDLQAELLHKNYERQATAIIKNFHPRPTEPLNKPAREFQVTWVANVKAVKQPTVFVRLAQRLTHLNAHFTMLGGMQLDEADRKAFERSVANAPNLTYVGAVSQDAVNLQLAKSHLLVNTSVYEGFSNTFIQAWQRQAPVCSLNVDPDGLLSKAKLGTCAAGDESLLAEQVEELLKNSDLRESTASNAFAYAEENHSIAAADRLIGLL